MFDVLSSGSAGMLGREGRAGWVRRADGWVSRPAVYGPHAHNTTPWPPPQSGGELQGRLPSVVKEGLGVVALENIKITTSEASMLLKAKAGKFN
jgi:hypothetical protein